MPPRRPSTTRALARSLKARPPQPWEEGTAALARRLAQQIDAADDPAELARLSGRYLAVLAALGMTRDRRPEHLGEVTRSGDRAPDPVEQLRAQRARLRDSSAVDPPAS